MAYDVKVNIDLTKPVGKVGFGVPLILLEYGSNSRDYTEVSSLAEVVEAGFDAESLVYKTAQLMFAQNNAPKTIAVKETNIVAESELPRIAHYGWRQLIVVREREGQTNLNAIITAVEGLEGKMFFAGIHNDIDGEQEITASGLRRTVYFYGEPTEDVPVPVAALVGETAGRPVGSFTYKNLKLTGIDALDGIEDSRVKEIGDAGFIIYIYKAGDAVTSEGKVMGGEYIDVIDSEDYIVQQLTYKTQKLLNNADKIPYDNNGIAMLESVAVDVLQDAYNNGMIATKADGTPDYTVSYELVEDTSESDRANRQYLGGKFSFRLAGAVHSVEITGTITT